MKKVFIASSFSEDKITQVKTKLIQELKEINIYPIDLDDNIAVSQPALNRSLSNINHADIVIFLIGDEYGSIPDGYDKSYTHLEYEEAIKLNKKIYIFGIGKLYDNNQIIYSNNLKMKQWQEQILNEYVISKYPNDLDIEKIAHYIVINIYQEENKIWYDEETGLIWQVNIDTTEEHGRLPWNDIFIYCENKNKENFAGFNDWRVPEIDELDTLLTDKGCFNSYAEDKESFIKKPLLYSMRMKYARFWSSTSNEQDYHFAYGINFNRKRTNSQSKQGKKEKYKTRYVRCVRLWMHKHLENEWDKLNKTDINEIQNFINKYPNSKYQEEAQQMIDTIQKQKEVDFRVLPLFEQIWQKIYINNIPEDTFLLKAIKDGKFDDVKSEAIERLKIMMQNNKTWKEKSTARNIQKDKKYQRTLEVIEMMKEC